MKKIFYLCLFSLFLMQGCSKEADNSPAGNCTQGNITFSNLGTVSYDLYVDAILKGTINSKNYYKAGFPTGIHHIRILDKGAGTVSTPVKEGDINVVGCDNQEFIFP